MNENAIAFLNQIDSIKSTDVSSERLRAFASEEDFNGVTVELLIEVGSYVCVAANLFPGTTRRWNRSQAVLGGHLVRLYKLILALLDQICQHRREITFIVARLAFECIVNLRYLIKFADDPAVFDSYIAYSLRQERRLHDKIGNNINASGGKELPVHTRMLNSIAKAVKASGARIEDLSPSRPKNWADKNLFERAQAVGLDDGYLGAFGGPFSSVHGNWGDLLEFQLMPRGAQRRRAEEALNCRRSPPPRRPRRQLHRLYSNRIPQLALISSNALAYHPAASKQPELCNHCNAPKILRSIHSCGERFSFSG